jgi:hypothetical protein
MLRGAGDTNMVLVQETNTINGNVDMIQGALNMGMLHEQGT